MRARYIAPSGSVFQIREYKENQDGTADIAFLPRANYGIRDTSEEVDRWTTVITRKRCAESVTRGDVTQAEHEAAYPEEGAGQLVRREGVPKFNRETRTKDCIWTPRRFRR